MFVRGGACFYFNKVQSKIMRSKVNGELYNSLILCFLTKFLNQWCTYQIGEVLVEMTGEEAQSALEVAKETCQGEIDSLKAQADGYKQTLSDLKTQLYAKFGTNINLDLDDES